MALRLTRRVEALRAIALNVKDQESREAMLDWGADYERLADRAIEVGTLSIRRG